MDIGNKVEKLYIMATDIEGRAFKIIKAIEKEYGVDFYENIEDDFVRRLCETLDVLRGGTLDFTELIENSDL